MGIFDGFASGIVGGVASAFGQMSANKANKKMAENQMDFQREMSNTSYQRSIDDMRKAGINPILAYKQGGASSPSGATATMGNVGAAGAESFERGASGGSARSVNAKQKQLMDTQSSLNVATANTQNDQQVNLQEQAKLNKALADKASVEANGARMSNEVKRSILQATTHAGKIKSDNPNLQYLDIITESLGQIFGSGNSAKQLFTK